MYKSQPRSFGCQDNADHLDNKEPQHAASHKIPEAAEKSWHAYHHTQARAGKLAPNSDKKAVIELNPSADLPGVAVILLDMAI